MRRIVLSIVALSAITTLSPTQAEPNCDLSVSISEMVSQLRTQLANAPVRERPAFSAAIDSLIRLRDRDSWPVINSPIAITTLQNSKWQSEPDANGFRQSLSLGGNGGTWHTHPDAKPFTINWVVESNRLRISHMTDFKDSFNYQIVDRTFEYQIKNDTLTMKRGDQLLTWQYVSK